jgi:hypothetical protein
MVASCPYSSNLLMRGTSPREVKHVTQWVASGTASSRLAESGSPHSEQTLLITQGTESFPDCVVDCVVNGL